ncbi:MAG: Asp-tRNA(Asn)/Glu-tRNA(Gln) amidotransferase subunit GatA [Spirochaetales bacterium]|jgi:aspartyl-tRNA(Asn)/glutamyl-tRNA(Gln) amidotransferase subunit A|nr:Asp-tRNA(Asn)/Glu-tRNA(Gln) amidotransferase subunit GatA [Spirochaetales bacterium]
MESLFKRWVILSDSTMRKKYEAYIKSTDAKIAAFLEFDVDRGLGLAAEVGKGGELEGVPFAVKDIIAVRGFRLTCGSKILENFVSPYTATAVEKLIAKGGVMVGKTNLDEFGMGSSTDNSALGKTNNPWDTERVCGGSSGGSAAAVAAGMVPFALGSDTGGSVRQPAAFCGVYGLKPTYGAVSRYGLVAYASSLEVIGVCARSVGIARTVFDIMKGQDEKDQSSLNSGTDAPEPEAGVIGVLGGNLGLDPAVDRAYRATIDFYRSKGFEIREINLSMADYYVPVYYTIATAEASANLARYTGIRYGYRPGYAENPEELTRKARSEGFGNEVKLRILLGTYVLRSGFQDQYYQRAQRLRQAIRADFDRAFTRADVILMPVFPTQAFLRGQGGLDQFQQKLADRFTTAANLAGLPALSFPAAVSDGLPAGMQFLAPAFGEARLFDIVRLYEEHFPCPQPPSCKPEWS